MKYSTQIIFIVIILCCTSENNESLTLKVSFVDLQSTKYGMTMKIALKFESAEQRKILFDWKTLSRECGDQENEDLIARCDHDLNKITNAMAHSQILIENKNGDMFFFTDHRVLHKKKPAPLVNCGASWLQQIELQPGQANSIISGEKFEFDLKPKKTDALVRMHYIFKPTPDQLKDGFGPFTLTSNWIDF